MEKKFTSDWFSHNDFKWNIYLEKFKDKPCVDFLEIGSYEGMSCLWLLENILTHEKSKITCCDAFYDEEYKEKNGRSLQEVFMVNTKEYAKKITLIDDYSFVSLRKLIDRENKFDFIYIDGCHSAKSVIEDAVLSFHLIKSGGIIIFDDYKWGKDLEIINRPQASIDAFLTIYSNYFHVLSIHEQVVLEKI